MKRTHLAAAFLTPLVLACISCEPGNPAVPVPSVSPGQLPEKDVLLKALTDKYAGGRLFAESQALAALADPTTIPVMIGVIDADNSYDTIYGVGYFGLGYDKLGKLTGVRYSPYHDGAWWRRWWAANKSRFPKEAQDIPIPDLPKTENGKKHEPYPEALDSLDGKLAWLKNHFEKGEMQVLSEMPQEIAAHGDPKAIPLLIGIIDADNTYDTIYGVGYFGLGFDELGKVTGVKYDESHNGAWWRRWWDENKSRFPKEVQDIPIPGFTKTASRKQPDARAAQADGVETELADVPSLEIRIGDDANKRYFLIGPKAGAQPPQSGFKLAIVMPGGDGSADFNPFVRRILKNALGPEWLIAEPVAVQWQPTQQIVWPTEISKVEGQQFSTEVFVETIIADVNTRQPVDMKHVVTLSWSSSGPAAYAISLQPKTSVTGSYIAMSVFKPAQLPALTNVKGRRYHIEHSPQDKVCPFADAQAAREQLAKAGAVVNSADYEGGHGWHGDAFGRIRDGMEWLTRD